MRNLTTTGYWRWLAALVLIAVVSGCATTKQFQVQALETRDLRVLYPQGESYLAPYAARTFENSLHFQEKTFGWKPWDKNTILLTDLSDWGNAGTSVTPLNRVTVMIAPADLSFGTEPGSERMFMTANHELVHAATMDGWNSRDKAWRDFFGGKPRQTDKHPETILYNYLTVPRFSVPRWYLEGSAVFMETWMSGGWGRAQGPYDEMVFRAMVRDHAHFYSPLGLMSEGTKVSFEQMSNAYLYGTRFMSYLALHYSPQMLIEWLKRGNDSKAYYAAAFKQVFHLPLKQAWNDWIAWEHRFQTKNLHKVREYPLTRATPLTSRALGAVSRSYINPRNDTLIGAFEYPGVLAYVGVINLRNGHIRRLTDIKGPTSYSVAATAYDPASGTFFFTQNNNAHRDLMEVNVHTGKVRLLLKKARIGDLAFDRADRSLWGVRHLNGFDTLVRIPYPYTDWQQIHTWPYGTEAFDLDVSPDGRMLSASMHEIDGSNFVRIFDTADLRKKKLHTVAEFNFGQAAPENFVFTADGRYLYGSSYYTGISNIYRYDIATKDMEAVSNAATGFFRPMPLPNGKLAVLEYTGQGFQPVEIDPVPVKNLSAITFLGTVIAKKHPVVKTWGVGSPSKVPLKKMITYKGKFEPIHHIQPIDRYPVLLGYRGDVAVGWHFDFADPLNLYKIGVTAGISAGHHSHGSEREHLAVSFTGLNWYGHYWHNYANFYDLFGPFQVSRKGDSVAVGYKRDLIVDLPRELSWNTSAAYYTGLNTLPAYQNVRSRVTKLLVVESGLHYKNRRSSAGAVDRERGWDWGLDTTSLTTSGQTIWQLRGGINFGFMLPVPHMSVWLYNFGGISSGHRDDPLARYYFGGFQNNYVDFQDPKHYRTWDSFPGFDIDAIGGRTFVKSTLELNLPPWRFESLGSPGFYLSLIRPAIFGGILVADPSHAVTRQTSRDLGFQLDLEFTVLNHLPMTLSAGYARGFSGPDGDSNEWMLSLKVL